MNNQHLQKLIADEFKSQRPLDKESAMVIVRGILKDYPKQLQEFGEWFEKHSDVVLKRTS